MAFDMLIENLHDGKRRGLGIQGVEYGLNQNDVHTTLYQATCSQRIIFHEFAERNDTCPRVIDIDGNGSRFLVGPQYASDKAGFVAGGKLVSTFTGKFCRLKVNFMGVFRQAITFQV